MHASYPIWWQGIQAAPPAEWTYMFDAFTGEESAEQWALGAAIFVAQTRPDKRIGPTFSELFLHLLPDTHGLPGPFPEVLDSTERRFAVDGFRGHVTIEWRRRGLLSFEKGAMRSLRVGRQFRQRSRERQLAGARPSADSPGSREFPEGS